MSDITNSAMTAIASALIVDGIVPSFASANAHVGAGDSTTAFVASQNDLQAATNKLRKAATATRNANVLTFIATFLNTDAVYDWEELAVFNDASAGTMLARRVVSLGTKPNTQEWIAQIEVTFAAA